MLLLLKERGQYYKPKVTVVTVNYLSLLLGSVSSIGDARAHVPLQVPGLDRCANAINDWLTCSKKSKTGFRRLDMPIAVTIECIYNETYFLLLCCKTHCSRQNLS